MSRFFFIRDRHEPAGCPTGSPLRTGSPTRGVRDPAPATACTLPRPPRPSADIRDGRRIRRPRLEGRGGASGTSKSEGHPENEGFRGLSDVEAVRRRVSDSRDTFVSSSRPRDPIATRPRRIRARSAVSGARACPAKCVPSPPRVVSSHPRKRVQKKARKEVSHRVSRVRRPESLTGLNMRIRHEKKRISPTHLDSWTTGEPGTFCQGSP